MNIKVSGPSSEMEAEANKKLISEKEIKSTLSNNNLKKQDLNKVKNKIRDLINFYDRIIRSISHTLNMLEKKNDMRISIEKNKYYNTQKRDLNQAKRERSKFKRYLNDLNEKINTI